MAKKKKKMKLKKGFRLIFAFVLIVVLIVFALDFFDISSKFIKKSKPKKQEYLW